MKRAESLAALAAWASGSLAPYLGQDSHASRAVIHGLAAVWAVRFKPYTGPLAEAYAIRFIREESRSAVRAALSAVGLKTL